MLAVALFLHFTPIVWMTTCWQAYDRQPSPIFIIYRSETARK